MIVVDASVLAPALADDGDDGDRARGRLRAERLAAPGIMDLEVASVIRRALLAGDLHHRRAAFALDDLRALRLRRVGHLRLLPRIWELRHNLTPYDAAYVALAEALGTVLVTADQRLAQAAGPRCTIEQVL
ncbi:MAG: type II toxin-antitoxin system VapC family toxin [Actinomycetota bacterium]|nr:type II toxin-antitoxin system VapC family toxin [Actinomycetota bacterium]